MDQVTFFQFGVREMLMTAASNNVQNDNKT